MGQGQGRNWVKFLREAETRMAFTDLEFRSEIGLGCVIQSAKCWVTGFWMTTVRFSPQWADSVTSKGFLISASRHHDSCTIHISIYLFQLCTLAKNGVIIMTMLVIMVMKEGGRWKTKQKKEEDGITINRKRVSLPPFSPLLWIFPWLHVTLETEVCCWSLSLILNIHIFPATCSIEASQQLLLCSRKEEAICLYTEGKAGCVRWMRNS